MVISNYLCKSEQVIGYIEIFSDVCDLSDKSNLTKLYSLYYTIYNEIKSLPDYTSYNSLSVKIFSNYILFSDEVVYPVNDCNEEYPRHDLAKSLSLMFQYISSFQVKALVLYKWLLKGYVTRGLLFSRQLRQWREWKNGEFLNLEKYTSDIDFVWGEAQLYAYNKIETCNYPYIFIDESIVKDTKRLFPLQSSMWVYDDPETKQSIVNFGFSLLNSLSKDKSKKLLHELELLKENCKNDKIFQKYDYILNYLKSIKPDSTCFYSTPEENISSQPLNFKQSYVLYIDMLGTKAKLGEEENEIGNIKKSNFWLNAIYDIYSTSLNRLEQLKQILAKHGEIFNFNLDDFHIKIFTDNILVSYPKNDNDTGGFGLNTLIFFAGLFQAYAIEQYKWMCYGTITLGEIYQDEVFFCGPALKDINIIEKSRPHYPRIIVTNNLYQDMNKDTKKQLGLLNTINDGFVNDNTQIVNYLDILRFYSNNSDDSQVDKNFMDAMYTYFDEWLEKYTDDKNIQSKIKHIIWMYNKNTTHYYPPKPKYNCPV